MIGSVEVITGPMFAGKTSELIRRIKRLNHRGRKCLVFKPKIDNRYSETKIVSHDKEEYLSVNIEKAKEILTYVKESNIKHIAIDEAQFFSRDEQNNLYEVIYQLKKEGYNIIVNGLDMDNNGNPFGLMPEIMAIADEVLKLTAVCMYPKCDRDAPMSFKKKTNNKLIDLGEKDLYEARCFKHWIQDI